MPTLENTLLLFDIDGTLLNTDGAGRAALNEAFLHHLRWPDATTGVTLAGGTDRQILRRVGARFDTAWGEHPPFDVPAFQDTYFAALERQLSLPGRVKACPGLSTLLPALRDAGAQLALLTGNWEGGARRKLGAVGLNDWFAWGVFGDDAEIRDQMVPIARARAAEKGRAPARIVVIGDTQADVACARAGGADAVVVQTGWWEAPTAPALHPDLLVQDLDVGAGALLDFLQLTR